MPSDREDTYGEGLDGRILQWEARAESFRTLAPRAGASGPAPIEGSVGALQLRLDETSGLLRNLKSDMDWFKAMAIRMDFEAMADLDRALDALQLAQDEAEGLLRNLQDPREAAAVEPARGAGRNREKHPSPREKA